MQGAEADVTAVNGGVAGDAGVPHGERLVRFAEAVLQGDAAEFDAASEAVRDAVGEEGFVDAAGVVATFCMMVRIADGTGIPLDAMLERATGELREQIDVARFASSANSPR